MEMMFSMLALAVVAAISDLLTGEIPNPLILAGAALGFVLSVLNAGSPGPLMSLAGFGLGMLLLLPGYLLRFTGAGDVKLMATLGIFSGPGLLLQIFAAAVICGALFILLKAAWRLIRDPVPAFRRYGLMLQTLLYTKQLVYLPSAQGSLLKQRLPMAPFYALGCTIVLLLPLIEAGG